MLLPFANDNRVTMMPITIIIGYFGQNRFLLNEEGYYLGK